MGAETKVTNLTNGSIIKRSQAYGRIDSCLSAWVEEGFTIRDLTLYEMVKAIAEKTRLAEPLPFAEIPGLTFQPPASTKVSLRSQLQLAGMAHQFVAEAIA